MSTGHVVALSAVVALAVVVTYSTLAAHGLLPDILLGGFVIQDAQGKQLHPVPSP